MHPSWLCIQHMSEKDPGQSHANEFLANLKPMSPLGKDRSLRWVAGAGGFWQSFVRGCYIQSAKLVFWYHKKSSFHRYSKNAAFLQLKRIREAFTLKQQQHLPWERNSKKIKGSCSAHAPPHMKDSRMLNSAIDTLFCGHYRGREEAFVERVTSGWIDYLPNWKDVLCFENFSLSLIFLCKLSTWDHENMAVVERWPLVEIRLYFLCASREGASQRGRRKHSSLKEQVSRGSGKNCIVEGWISCAVILPGKEDEETLCWCATFKSFYLFIYIRKHPGP